MRLLATLPIFLLLAACPASKKNDALDPNNPNNLEDVRPFVEDQAKREDPNRRPPLPEQANTLAHNPNAHHEPHNPNVHVHSK